MHVWLKIHQYLVHKIQFWFDNFILHSFGYWFVGLEAEALYWLCKITNLKWNSHWYIDFEQWWNEQYVHKNLEIKKSLVLLFLEIKGLQSPSSYLFRLTVRIMSCSALGTLVFFLWSWSLYTYMTTANIVVYELHLSYVLFWHIEQFTR